MSEISQAAVNDAVEAARVVRSQYGVKHYTAHDAQALAELMIELDADPLLELNRWWSRTASETVTRVGGWPE